MFNKQPPVNSKAQGVVESSLYGFATILGLIAMILVTPALYSWSDDFVYRYLLSSYGDRSLAEIGTYIWGALIGGGIFFLSRAFFVLALLLIAQRLLVLAF